MASSHFAFKQFTIHQQHCAMKVCTDSCLFGAWMARQCADANGLVTDWGAGTGLLSLMLAQAWPQARFEAIEIDEAAADQCRQNVAQSAFGQRITVMHASISDHIPPEKPALIVTNPPFHEQQLASTHKTKKLAHHGHDLLLNQWIEHAARMLGHGGKLGLLLPAYRHAQAMQLLHLSGFGIAAQCMVQHHAGKPAFRTMILATKDLQSSDVQALHICIKGSDGNYSSEFTALLKDYYLFL